jgi:hypothetical protein
VATTLPRRRLLPVLTLLVAVASAHADDDALLGSGSILLRWGARSAVVVEATWPTAAALPDAGTTGATLRIAGASGEGDSGPITLPAAHWSGGGRALRYTDRTGSAGGIRSIVLRVGKRGGKLRIVGGGKAWRYAVDGPQSRIGVVLTIGTSRWCTEFPQSGLKTRRDRVRGRLDAPPAECPCVGNVESTWAAVRQLFEAHGCTASACHGSAPGQGNLDLTGDGAWAALVDAPSTIAPDVKRVEPGAPQKSLLWRKLAARTEGLTGVPGSPMPSNDLPLSTAELAAIEKWIYGGAPATTVVPGTERLLDACLPAPEPQKIRPPDPPAPGEGVQLYGAPWTIPPNDEGEVCYATYYDVAAAAASGNAVVPCPDDWGGPTKDCFYFDRQALTQDPNSHHSILRLYRGASDVTDPKWGAWTCHGGAQDGTTCDPLGIGIPAPAGADCGPDGGCASAAKPAPGCLGFGPDDLSANVSPGLEDSAAAPQILISTQPYFARSLPPGVSGILPVRGILVTNSHAFNPTDVPTTNEQWLNVYFSPPEDRVHRLRDLFDSADIFVAQVPAFEQREYCRTITFPKGTRLFRMTTHTHKYGKLFRVWGPGIANHCVGSDPSCTPPAGTPFLVTTDYADPAEIVWDTPLALDGDTAASRTFQYCALYDNGAEDPATVRRKSVSFAPETCTQLRCVGGTRAEQNCSTDAQCPGGGVCDACDVHGGLTTDDEMFILMGDYYCMPGTDCAAANP